MATTIFQAAPSNTSDALFRAWGSGLSTALATVGMIKTSDTGQINWTTVTAPGSINTYTGYEVWRFNDALQATVPIFFKVEYGAGSALGIPGMRLTVGKGSDGTGTITGILHAAAATSTNNFSNTMYSWCVSSSDGSGLNVAPAPGYYDGFTYTFHWLIERSRDATGAATGTGVLVFFAAGNTAAPNVRVYNYANASGLSYTSLPGTVPSTSVLSYGGPTPIFPALVADGRGNYWQPRSIMYAPECALMTQMSVPGLGLYLGIAQYTATTVVVAVRCVIAWY